MSNEHKHTKLGQFFATAICGNDILSSALYVSGIAALFAGIYAPIVLLCVGVVLLLYRSVYREVVEALPVNGGAYNALLNSASKGVASVAGTMTVLSYIATAVISAKTAIEYLFQFIRPLFETMHLQVSAETFRELVVPFTIVILFAFALLVIAGVKDSAKVVAGIFSLHLVTLTLFIIIGVIFWITKGGNSIILHNIAVTKDIVANNGGLLNTIFLAFSVSLLGISGFESSANFVEEQQPGVFKKTLRNMTAGVTVFNPLIAAVCLLVLPMVEIINGKDFLLASVAFKFGGMILLGLIAIDAFLVLCGAVLTSYVGVSGLMYRMSLDHILPQFFSKKNNKGSYTRIILLFFALCLSILLVTRGDLLSLAGVYTISFLSVMTLFAVGNLILRRTRRELKRPYRAPVIVVILAALSTIVGIIGNIQVDHQNVMYFLIYFIPAILIVMTMLFKRDFLLTVGHIVGFIPKLKQYINGRIDLITESHYYVFLHDMSNIFPALEYINRNENGKNVTFVHCQDKDQVNLCDDVLESVRVFKKSGVFPHMNINCNHIDKKFGPETVREFTEQNNISPSKVFIGSIHETHEFDYQDFGGVRIILE
ncbi:MAG TPA: APC family permease [Candidatus Udaeobacter sp.]|nr:APC family permease [Candidatus Udaeobacter sp.]